jgi:F-type H+-transporting ATPase subunit delta
MAEITLRYAHALEQVVLAAKLDGAAVLAQLKDIAGTFEGSSELREVLMDPSIAREQKLRVLDAISARIGIYPQVRNFVAVIIEHERLHEMNEIVSEFARIADDDAGIADAEITTARVLTDDDRSKLEEQVAKLAGSRVRAVYSEDDALLGGAIVKIGSTIYDGSIRGQLQQMKQKLVNA